MLRVIAFGLAAGAAIQAWRNFPPDGPLTSNSLAVAFIVGLVAAFLSGWFMGRPWRAANATAVASAVAEARAAAASQSNASVQVLINNARDQAGAEAQGGVRVPEPGAVSWMAERPLIASVEDVDGMDLSDLGIEEHEHRTA